MKGFTGIERACNRLGLTYEVSNNTKTLDDKDYTYIVISNGRLSLELYARADRAYILKHDIKTLVKSNSQAEITKALCYSKEDIFERLRNGKGEATVRTDISKKLENGEIGFKELLKKCNLSSALNYLERYLSIKHRCSVQSEFYRAYHTKEVESDNSCYEALVQIKAKGEVYWLISYNDRLVFGIKVPFCVVSNTPLGQTVLIEEIKEVFNNSKTDLSINNLCMECRQLSNRTSQCSSCVKRNSTFTKWLEKRQHSILVKPDSLGHYGIKYDLLYNLDSDLPVHIDIICVDNYSTLDIDYELSIYDPYRNEPFQTTCTKKTLCVAIDNLVSRYVKKYKLI